MRGCQGATAGAGGEVGLVVVELMLFSHVGNPKSETRNPKQIQSSKKQCSKPAGLCSAGDCLIGRHAPPSALRRIAPKMLVNSVASCMRDSRRVLRSALPLLKMSRSQ